MLKQDLIDKLSDSPLFYKTGKSTITQMVDLMFKEILDAVLNGERVLIRGVGAFEPAYRKPYIINHPDKTKGKVMAHERIGIRFSPALNIKKRSRLSNEQKQALQQKIGEM